MREPPDTEQEGVASAGTPTTPKRVPNLGRDKKSSSRSYTLERPKVNEERPCAEPRVSEAGPGAPVTLTDAEKVFLEICHEKTGEQLSEEQFSKNVERRTLLVQQSFRIADALESEGVKAYGNSKLALFGVCSGEIIELPDFRNIVYIPLVAQRKRSAKLKQLEYFLQEHSFSRMWVFTAGERAILSDVGDTIQTLHRRLSKLNAAPFLKAAGVEIVFRSTELGEVKRDAKKEATFHIHAHCIIKLSRKLPSDDWTALLGTVRKWWKYHFRDSKRIHQAREACKYVVKPGDLDLLASTELAELHRQLFKKRLVESLGALREQEKWIRESKSKLVSKKIEGTSRLVAIQNWNKSRKKQREEDSTDSFATPVEDWIISTLPPSFALGKRAEPLAVVLNFSGTRIGENRRLKLIREACAEQFAD